MASVLANKSTTNLVSDHVLQIVQWVMYVGLCQVIEVLGIVTNIINIVCFIKQGFKDAMNVSLLGLAISDLGSLIFLSFTNICLNPAFQESDLPFEPIDMQYLLGSWPHIMFARVSSWITAFITLERCLCVTLPLKVRLIITPRRVSVIICGIYFAIICSVSPVYYANGYGWIFSPKRNRTILGLIFTSDRQKVEGIAFAVNNILVPISAFIVVIICTTTLVINLRSKSKWREACASAGQARVISQRDLRTSRLVIVIALLFIVCYSPVCLFVIALLFIPGLAIDGQYFNLTKAAGCVVFLLQAANAAVNSFIYYNMSSKYKAILLQMFRRNSVNKKQMHSREVV